jgi:hypothetical protein
MKHVADCNRQLESNSIASHFPTFKTTPASDSSRSHPNRTLEAPGGFALGDAVETVLLMVVSPTLCSSEVKQ